MSDGYSFWDDEDWILNNLNDLISEVANGPPLLLEEFNSSKSSGSKKRNRDLDPGNSQEANGNVRKKQRRCLGTFYTGESSTSRQQERLKGKTVAGMAKVYKDRISRRIKNDTKADMEVIIRIVCNMMAINASHLLPRVFGSLEQIKTQWPIRPDLQHIKQKIQEIESNCKDDSLTDEAKRRFVEVGDELERLDQERLKDSTKAGNLDAVFTDFSMGTLQKEHVCG
ncbi:Coiled-coil domain-containing 27 [Gossypium australe]|uniref:Coiled-coil domain-containing 27 n=1 Tax=Gossypium australe TaxID=47621 RepID=A0A5B6VRF5_9ROSI|nr:Coiled-coil domain-containing 27 [Gossypium australe]